MPEFHVVSEYSPAGDQPQAIEKLAEGVAAGLDEQTLLGVTGSGKTYTMAKVIERVQKPTLVLAHNKTLAAPHCSEIKEFFPDNAELEKSLRAAASPGDIILTVGAGDVYKIGERLVAEGKEKT